MDTKNVIAAITLSSAIIILWSLFMIPEQPPINQDLNEKVKVEQNTDTPSVEQKETLVTLSRDEALKQSNATRMARHGKDCYVERKGTIEERLVLHTCCCSCT